MLDVMFKRPVFQSTHLKFGRNPPTRPTVAKMLRLLTEAGMLKVVREGAGRRATVFALAELINLCEGKRVV